MVCVHLVRKTRESKMKNSLRKVLLALVMVCFILTAANVAVVQHLIEHHKDESHDHEHCPICQQAIVNTAKAVLPDAPVIKEQPQVTIADVYVIHHFVKDFKFLTPHTRAPPAAV
jgi:hypothetical protein